MKNYDNNIKNKKLIIKNMLLNCNNKQNNLNNNYMIVKLNRRNLKLTQIMKINKTIKVIYPQ